MLLHTNSLLIHSELTTTFILDYYDNSLSVIFSERSSKCTQPYPLWFRVPLNAFRIGSVVWCAEIQIRSNGHDAEWIDGLVAHEVVLGDVFEIDCIFDIRSLVDISCVSPSTWIVDYSLLVALEMPHIHQIKANEGHEKSYVRLCQLVSC